MEIDTSNLTEEQIEKIKALASGMAEENSKANKWWIMPKYSIFCENNLYNQFGPCYYVEPQKDIYSRSKPPLKMGFNSKEEAQEWLNNYLAEEDKFLKAVDEINSLNRNLGHLVSRLNNHQYITNTDLLNCFKLFNDSWDKGPISRVIKDE